MRRLLFLAVMLLAITWSLPAFAHQTGRSTFISNIKPKTHQVDTLLRCPARDLAHTLRVDPGDDGMLDPAEIASGWTKYGFYLDKHIKVLNNGVPCPVSEYKNAPPNTAGVYWLLKSFRCAKPLGTVTYKVDAMLNTPGGYRHFGRIQLGDQELATVFDARTPTYVVSVSKPKPPDIWDTFLRFLWEGIMHILSGWDHILFICGLVLVATNLKRLLTVVTAFTISHSITLALSALNVFTIPPTIVEPLIAVSVAWMAIEAIIGKKDSKLPYLTTFLFGFVHGFGFSYILRNEMQLPTEALIPALFAFNLGVEIGQLGVVTLTYPLRAAIRDRKWERQVIIAAGSIIAAIAMYWFFQRI